MKEYRKTVAIVDDNIIYRKLLNRLLLAAGFCIAFEAEHGLDCLKKMQETTIHPFLILMDLEMPGMNGFETIQEIKLRWPHVKIIANSSSSDPKMKKHIIECGADMFLSKIYNLDELITSVKQLQY